MDRGGPFRSILPYYAAAIVSLILLPVHGGVESWARWLWICKLRLRSLRTPCGPAVPSAYWVAEALAETS